MRSLKPRHFVLPLILLVALAFRVYRLVAFPPGFHFDEAIDLKIALDVLGGARPIYVAEGWGREALYYYLVAPMLRLIDYNPLALRATAVLCGMGVLVAAYGLARRLRGQTAAWLTAAWLAVAMWPVWAARFGVRHISLALLLGLAAWAFWWSFGRIRNYELGIRNIEFLIAGALLGLTAYTYQPARFVPLLFGGFALYLLLFHRRPTADTAMWHNRRGWAVWGLTAAVVALPLIVVLTQVTPIETGERAFSIEPLTELLGGNPRPVLANAVAVAGVFTVRGDPLKSYNLPDRPLFVPRLTGVFFYVGLALAVWRWRRPANAFVLLWLVAGLLPTVVTISAPNFNRMVAAQFPIFFLAALGATEVIDWAAARRRWAGAGAAALVVVALGLTAAATARDLFRVWPEQFADAHPLNREIAAVADFLEHRADGRPVVISSRDIEDEDPYVVSVSLDRAIDRRWVDSSQALALPAGAAEAWLIVTADRWIDPLLADAVNLGEGSPPLGAAQPAAPAPGGLKPAAIQPTPVQPPPTPAPPGGLKPAAINPNRLKPVADDAANPLQRVSFASRGFQPAAVQPAPFTFQPPRVQSALIQPAAPPPPGGLKPAAISPNRLKPVADDAANPLQRVSFASRGFQPAAIQPAPVQPAPFQPPPVQPAPPAPPPAG